MRSNAPLIIGQCLNAAGSRRVARALERRDAEEIAAVARRQVTAWAEYLDVCAAGTPDEAEALAWLTQTVQNAVDVPLSLDTHNPAALRRAIPLCRRPPLVNSFSLDHSADLWALLREWPLGGVVALCLDERGPDATAADRLDAAARLADRLSDCGVPPADILFDPLTLPARNGRAARETTLQTVAQLRERFPESRVLIAVGNYGYGLAAPVRRAAERSSARAALRAGANAFLCDPAGLNWLPGRSCGEQSR